MRKCCCTQQMMMVMTQSAMAWTQSVALLGEMLDMVSCIYDK